MNRVSKRWLARLLSAAAWLVAMAASVGLALYFVAAHRNMQNRLAEGGPDFAQTLPGGFAGMVAIQTVGAALMCLAYGVGLVLAATTVQHMARGEVFSLANGRRLRIAAWLVLAGGLLFFQVPVMAWLYLFDPPPLSYAPQVLGLVAMILFGSAFPAALVYLLAGMLGQGAAMRSELEEIL